MSQPTSIDTEEKRFEHDLQALPKENRDIYSKILLDEKIKLAKENNGRPVQIELERREELLRLARASENIEEAKKLLKIEQNWNTATLANNGRPPIGGAQD